jgi:hypothetical protein
MIVTMETLLQRRTETEAVIPADSSETL